jgi:putative ABC transport system ATP-binding protein
MVAIMGRSGSGKTTLLNIIGTLDGFDMGSYYYNGYDVSAMSDSSKARLRSSEIGFVNQDFQLLNRKTAIDNVQLPLYFGKTKARDMKNLALCALDDVGIYEQANKKVYEMSGGQKQRVAIARALVIKPTVILADEPTGALDHNTAIQIMDILKELNLREKITVIIVTHDKEVADICDRIIMLDDGKIV